MTVTPLGHWTTTLLAAVAITVAAAALGCGSGTSPTTPTPSPNPSPSPGSTATITISGSGTVSPQSVTITSGGRITFVNNDTRAHDMSSDPHPDHTDCPAINQAGFLGAGVTRATGNLTVARTCGFHDHDQPTNRNLQGTIIVVP